MRLAPRITIAAALSTLVALVNAARAGGGNVEAYLGPDLFGENTVLMVVGDHLDNEVRITEDAPDHVRVEGLNGTTVNGLAADDVYAVEEYVFPYAMIDLGNGDDSVEYIFTGEQFRHGTEFTTGNGNDQVSIQMYGPKPVGPLSIDTGTGTDMVAVHLAGDAWLDGGFRINTGVGDDAVFVEGDNSDGGFPFLFRAGQIDTGEGNDQVAFKGWLAQLSADSAVFVLLGSGDDLLIGDPDSAVRRAGDVRAVGEAGDDTVLNAAYFRAVSNVLFAFETIVE